MTTTVFLPIILKDNLGFSMAASQCLIAPPYAFSAILMFTTAWFADRLQLRAPFIILNSLISLIGLPIVGFHPNPAVRYFGVFIGVAGVNACVPLVMAYQVRRLSISLRAFNLIQFQPANFELFSLYKGQ